MFFKRCRHERLSDVKDGYQYCEKCNKAFEAPVVECQHHWVERANLNTENIRFGNVYQIIFVLKCKKCGEIKTVTIV